LKREGGIAGVKSLILHGTQQIVIGNASPGDFDQLLGEGAIDDIRVGGAAIADFQYRLERGLSRGADETAEKEHVPVGSRFHEPYRVGEDLGRKPADQDVVFKNHDVLCPGGQPGAKAGHVRFKNPLFAIGRMAVYNDELNALRQADAGKFLPGHFAAIGAMGERNAVDPVEAAPGIGWRSANLLTCLQDGRCRHVSCSVLEGP